MKHTVLTGTLLLSCCAGLTSVARDKKENVNFVIIHLDDMGYGDLASTGATGYSTPNIDRMCSEGMRFTNFYSAQAVSSASRAGLMTGCYPNRIGFAGALGPNSKIGLSPEEETIATVLKKQGYVCGAVGKWHLGDSPVFMPLNHGFDEYYGLPYSNDMWPDHPTNKSYPPLPLYEGNTVVKSGLTAEDQEQLTTNYTERAVKFIEENRNRPFFLYLAHSMPHVPLFVSDKFKGKSGQGLYGDVMMELDWSVGEVLRTLRINKLERNTFVIFTSDNGPWINYGNNAGSTGGLREGKGTSFEGGQRVPCVFWWPGRVASGVINNNLASSIDFLPTLAELGKASLPDRKIDGVSLVSMLSGDPAAKPRTEILYYYRKNSLEAVRNEKFKLVFAHPGRTYTKYLPGNDGQPGRLDENFQFPPALYDMRRDPGERYDVMELYPDETAALIEIADRARADLGDDLTGAPGSNRRSAGRIE